MKISPLNLPAPKSSPHQLRWTGLSGSSLSLALHTLNRSNQAPLVVIADNSQGAHDQLRALQFFAGDKNTQIRLFSDWETLPYDHFSAHEDLISERMETLDHLSKMRHGIVVTTIATIMHRLSPRQHLQSQTFLLSLQDKLDMTKLRQQLVLSGYRNTQQVMTHGEFSVRGSIVDLFPMGAQTPFRIELFDDEIESIRCFDPETQRSIKKIDSIAILPAHEFPLTDEGIETFRTKWRAEFPGNPMDCSIYQAITQGEAPQGIEYYLPLFFDHLESFFDYLPENTQLVFLKDTVKQSDQFWREVNERYEQYRHDTTRPLIAPSHLFLPVDELFNKAKPFTQIKIQDDAKIDFNAKAGATFQIDHHDKVPLDPVKQYIEHFNGRVLVTAESAGRRETLMDLFHEINIRPKLYESWQHFIDSNDKVGITVANINDGFILDDPAISVITESQLFGQQVMQRRLRKNRQQDPNALIRNLTELTVGAPVVHIDHGVGRYCGLELIETTGIEAEYLTLEYANNDKVYVPIASLDLISRYTGCDADSAPLHRLGSKQWDKAKQAANKRIHDVAADLLDIYSRREASVGFAFPAPDRSFQAFRDAFPFEETPDQRTAIDNVINDMTKPQAMDHLVCGDVGFGKTEVAMQACFLAVNGGKQVAILTPTTLLAAQHGENFKDRFSAWPIRIGILTRLQTAKEQAATINDLADGKIDIVIGTHKILNPNIHFNDLGLLIVDEEHRFGVKQKEKIKSLRSNVDILTLTATPIPRTLNMALSGTRDLSIIATPPERRLAIKTFIHEPTAAIIKEAILRESMRGGQVYYLHNEVATINATADKLQKILPDARIAVAHGQMKERELENVMSDFYHQKFNVLVCTTIIESGIDVPTANTIIIHRADKFGLAQLHQLRGRVGRSHHQAYAYLLAPADKLLTRDARKRLEAITTLEDLGAGFMLATHDMEIRGAGELLGEDQSGQIHAIGFTLYMDLLERTVKELKEGEDTNPDMPLKSLNKGTEIDLHESALIPETYVMDIHIRLTLYKQLSSCQTSDAIQNVKAEMIDRFGLLPEVTQTLFSITHLKIKATPLGIKKIDLGSTHGTLLFDEKPKVDPDKIIHLIQTEPSQYQLQGANKLRLNIESAGKEKKIARINMLLAKLA
jgi:transcription-repair coupling factor (superfamily II helicase)